MKKIKIIHVIGSLNIGGAENVAMNILRYLDNQKFECDFLVFDKNKGSYEDEAISKGAKIIRIQPPSESYKKYYRNLVQIFQDGKYSVVHAHTLLNNGLVLKAACKAGVSMRISHSHSTVGGKTENLVYKMYSNLMKRMITAYGNKFIACGKEAGDFLYGKNVSWSILDNSVELDKFRFNLSNRQEIRNELNINDQNLVIGHVGRLSKEKNHIFLLNLFKEIYKENKLSKLVLVGDGPEKEKILKVIERLELQSAVSILGKRTDVFKIYSALDVMIFPSLYEGIPLTLIEAQANGLTILASNTISSEVKVTNSLEFLDLNSDYLVWQQSLVNRDVNIDGRSLLCEGMRNTKYDIDYFKKQVERIYEK